MTNAGVSRDDCQYTRDQIFAYLTAGLSADDHTRYAAHLAGCADCRAYVELLDDAIHLECRQLVALVTDYQEGRLSPAARTRFEAHLRLCESCETYLAQMRETIRLTGAAEQEPVAPEAAAGLLQVFRAWKGS